MSVETARSTATMSEKIVETLGDIVIGSLEATAQISLGQALLRVVDRFLWVVEKSAQWSLPVHEVNAEENGKAFGKIELVRPLPWIFFLPSLAILRACRLGINVGAVIMGYPKLQTTGVVKFIQKGRRRLRTIKSNGLKNMRYRKGHRNKEEELSEAKKSLIKSMLSTLSALSCLETSRRTPSPTPTRVCVQRNSEPEPTPTPEEKSTTESTSPPIDTKRKYSEVAGPDPDSESELQFEEESTIARLERLATEDSEADDQDFDPAEEELSSSETDDDERDDDDDDYISEAEINDIHRSNLLAKMAKVIIEEPEPEQEREIKPKIEVEPQVTSSNTMVRENNVDTLQITDDKEDISNFYSPISSPRSPGNSISDFTSPGDDDAKPSISVNDDHEQQNKNGSKVSSNVEGTTESVKVGNGGIDSDKSTEKSSSKISSSEGISPAAELQMTTTNGGTVVQQIEENGNMNDGRSVEENNSDVGGKKKKVEEKIDNKFSKEIEN